MNTTRREVLQASVGGLVAGLAGCLSEPGSDSESDSGADTDLAAKAAFFTVWDWTSQVSDGSIDVDDVVSVGQMGHGWEPPGDIALDVADSDVFVYLDTPEFSWAQNVASQVEDEGVAVIDTMNGVDETELLAWDTEPVPVADTHHDWDPDTVEVVDFDVVHRDSGNLVAYWHIDHWHGGLPDIQVGDSMTFDTVFADDEERVLPLGDDHPFQIAATVPDGIPGGDAVTIESHGDSIEIHGDEEGRTRIEFQLRAGDDVLWYTDPGLDVSVVEQADGEVEGVDDDDGEVAELYDPHVWVDPVLAQDQVAYLADELAELDPDNAEFYQDNAESYIEKLEAVDQQFRDVVNEADSTVAVFAGHDAFQYLEQRYGFRLHSPQGVAPDAEPSPDDIAETLEIVEDNDIDTILYDPFETDDHSPPPLAQRILDETDADSAEPLSPAEGTTEQWLEDGWGWVEQMEEMNIPSLKAALGAE